MGIFCPFPLPWFRGPCLCETIGVVSMSHDTPAYFFFNQTLKSKNSLENSSNSKWQNAAILIDIHKWHVQCKWCHIMFCFWQFVQKTHNLNSFLVDQLTSFIFLYYLQISWFANVSFDGVVSNRSVEWTWKRHQSFFVIRINLKKKNITKNVNNTQNTLTWHNELKRGKSPFWQDNALFTSRLKSTFYEIFSTLQVPFGNPPLNFFSKNVDFRLEHKPLISEKCNSKNYQIFSMIWVINFKKLLNKLRNTIFSFFIDNHFGLHWNVNSGWTLRCWFFFFKLNHLWKVTTVLLKRKKLLIPHIYITTMYAVKNTLTNLWSILNFFWIMLKEND